MLMQLYWFSETIETSLAPAKPEVGAEAKADQYLVNLMFLLLTYGPLLLKDHLVKLNEDEEFIYGYRSTEKKHMNFDNLQTKILLIE